MNYTKIYNSLIEKAQNRELSGYKEVHHITPRCLGGSDDKSNLVALTAREHFIAHKLLTKIYPDNPKLYYAFGCMSTRKTLSSIQYEDASHAKSVAMTMDNPAHKRTSTQLAELKEAKKELWKTNNPMFKEENRIKASERMKSQNPMTLYPEKNHTARPIIVEYMDGTIEEYPYAKQFADENNIPYVSVKYWIQKGKGSKKYNVKSVKKVL